MKVRTSPLKKYAVTITCTIGAQTFTATEITRARDLMSAGDNAAMDALEDQVGELDTKLISRLCIDVREVS